MVWRAAVRDQDDGRDGVDVKDIEPPGASRMSPSARHVVLAGLAIALVVALLATSIAVLAAIRNLPAANSHRPGSQAAGTGASSPEATADATPGASATPANQPFVCANPVGATTTYVFLNADHQIYRVAGCSTPVQLTHVDVQTSVTPLAFSATNRWLMVALGPAQQADNGGPPSCQYLMAPQTGALTKTSYCEDTGLSPTYPIDRFIAWVDDDTFFEAEFENPTSETIPVKVLRVSASTLASSTVATLTWVANSMTPDTDTGIRIRGGYLYFGGYMNASEGGAYLHRIALASGADTKLVRLGIADRGPCQVYDGPCNWTGPWDISQDGSRIVYHNPGPTIAPSDTNGPTETPLYIANPDGSGSVQLTDAPSGPNEYMSMPMLAPSGAWVVYEQSGHAVLVPTDGSRSATPLPEGYWAATWRSDSRALLLSGSGPNYTQQLALYSLATKAITPLATYTSGYVWGA
jgi:hypothetical protein